MTGWRDEDDEIEITPEMIEAGASAVLRALAPSRIYAPMTEEDLARAVFEAMSAASPSRANTSTSYRNARRSR